MTLNQPQGNVGFNQQYQGNQGFNQQMPANNFNGQPQFPAPQPNQGAVQGNQGFNQQMPANNFNGQPQFPASQPNRGNNVVPFNNGQQVPAPNPNNYAGQQNGPTNNFTGQQAPFQNNGKGYQNNSFNNGNNQNQGTNSFEKDEDKPYHERNKIVKIGGKGLFFEVYDYSFKYGKVAFQFTKYGNGQATKNYKIQLEFHEFERLARMIETQAIFNMEIDNYGNFHAFNKGIHAKYNNGVCRAKTLGIQPAQKGGNVLAFVYQEGPGQSSNGKLINHVGKADTFIAVPLTAKGLDQFIFDTRKHIQGYITAGYVHKLSNGQV